MRLCDRGAADSPTHIPPPGDGSDPTIRTFFFQRCPACGRALRTPIQLLGKRVDCSHCRRRFVAQTHEVLTPSAIAEDSPLERADRLLARLAGQRSG